MRALPYLLAPLLSVVLLVGCKGESSEPMERPADPRSLRVQAAKKSTACEPCAKDSDCGQMLGCDTRSFLCKPPDALGTDQPSCPQDCKNSEGCRNRGECTLSAGTCVPASNADCAGSNVCLAYGWCSLGDNTCTATANADCAKSDACRVVGHCGFDADEGCSHPTSDADCRASENCKAGGLCSAVNGVCKAATADHCKNTASCQMDKKGCYLNTDAALTIGPTGPCSDCPQGKQLSLRSGKCARVTTRFCKAEMDCEYWGRCTARDGRCIAAGDTSCEKSINCRSDGECAALDDGTCGVANAAQCPRGLIFRAASKHRKASCIQPEPKAGEIIKFGSSFKVDDRACEEGCKDYGACRFGPQGCGPGSDLDCASSKWCRRMGRCGLHNGRCKPTMERHCSACHWCRKLGVCSMTPSTDGGFECRILSDLDCMRSERCSRFDKCRYSKGECVK
jgi:hypothetical protein